MVETTDGWAERMTLSPLALFSYGVGCGLSLLLLSGYRQLSPAWVRRSLVLCAWLLILRYSAAALCPDFNPVLVIQSYWPVTLIGLLVPSIFCWDQLVRHPAYTPQKLLKLAAPLVLIEALCLLWILLQNSIENVWITAFSAGVGALAAVGWGAFCLTSALKISNTVVRRALIALAFVQAGILAQPLFAGLGMLPASAASFELFSILCLWFAFDSIRQAQQTF